MNATVVNQDIHPGYNHATEGLIIISQTVFFLVLFMFIKSYLLDNFGVMDNADALQKNALQVGAIYFAIVVFICIVMVPLFQYKYAGLVIGLVFIGVGIIIYVDVKRTMGRVSSAMPKHMHPILPVTPTPVATSPVNKTNVPSSFNF